MMNAPSAVTALIVDDEVFIAMDIAYMVGECGLSVLDPAISLQQAFSIIESTCPDVALMDINIGRDKIWPVARRLKSQGCPIVFISANAHHDELATEFAGAPVLDKPVSMDALQTCLRGILAT